MAFNFVEKTAKFTNYEEVQNLLVQFGLNGISVEMIETTNEGSGKRMFTLRWNNCETSGD